MKDLRFPKQFGDFAESLVMYLLGLNNKSVALIDHVGADVISVDRDEFGKRRAISVKGRNFPINESKSFDFDKNNIDKLKETANLLDMEASVAFVFVDEQEGTKKIRVLTADLIVLENLADDINVSFINRNSKHGLQIKFTQSSKVKHLENIKTNPNISYAELEFKHFNMF